MILVPADCSVFMEIGRIRHKVIEARLKEIL